MSLPLTYKPKSLRPAEAPQVREVAYSVCPLDGPKKVYEQGPFPTLTTALDCVPVTTHDTVLVKHNEDGTETVLYAWNHSNNHWYLLSHEES